MNFDQKLSDLLNSIPDSLAIAYIDTASGALLGVRVAPTVEIREDHFPPVILGMVEQMLIEAQDVREIFILRGEYVHLFLRSPEIPEHALLVVCNAKTNLGMAMFKARTGLPEVVAEARLLDQMLGKETADEPASVTNERIMVVDDSSTVRRVAVRFLEGAGLEVVTAGDGVEALQKLAQGPVRLVVTDLEMPNLDGFGLLRQLRRNPEFHELPVIVCTSRWGKKYQMQAQELGASAYIVKPFSRERLLSAITDAAGN